MITTTDVLVIGAILLVFSIWFGIFLGFFISKGWAKRLGLVKTS